MGRKHVSSDPRCDVTAGESGKRALGPLAIVAGANLPVFYFYCFSIAEMQPLVAVRSDA